MDYSEFAFPKPSDVDRSPEIIRVYPDGREVINKATLDGRREYRARTLEMVLRQAGRCCLEGYAPMCRGWMLEFEATFEHEWGRGVGKRDDRIILPDGTWINGAAHSLCNGWKGSRYIDYNKTLQRQLKPQFRPLEVTDGKR
jgi:hypothetical protein